MAKTTPLMQLAKALAPLALLALCVVLAAFAPALSTGNQAESSTPIYGVLMDTGQSIECYLVPASPTPSPTLTSTPSKTNVVFVTATAAASLTPPATGTPDITQVTPTEEYWEPTTQPTTMTTTVALNLRECAGTGCRVLLVIPSGKAVIAYSDRQLIAGVWWRRVNFDGTVGWVSEQYLR